MGNYHLKVRSEAMRGGYRESFSDPKPFVTEVALRLQDVLHTFKKGHEIQIQIQSTWFPIIDRNPQRYVENIFKAEDTDFVPATHRVYHSISHPTHLEVQVLDK